MISSRIARAFVVAGLALSLTGLASPALADRWSSFHGGTDHAGRAAVNGPQSFALAWYSATGSDVDGSAVFGADGTVYFAGTDGTVRALAPDGGEKWVYTGPARIYATPVLGPEDRVLIGDVNGRFRALNPADGSIVWTLSGLGTILAPAVVAADGTAYIGTERGELVAVDTNGVEKFRVSASGAITGAPAIGPGGHLFWGAADRRLRRMTPGGAIVWNVEVDGEVASSPAIGPDGTVYVGAGGSILAIDPDSGTIKWRVGAGADVKTTPAVAADGTVYAGADSGVLFAIAPSGSIRWQVQTGGMVRSSPAVGADGTVYVGSGDAIVYAFDAAGQRLSTFRALDAVHGAIAIGPNGVVYAGSRDNRLYALKDSARRFAESPADRLGGDLVRDPQTGRVFVVVDGVRRHIPDPATQLLLGLVGPVPQTATGPELARYPEGPALPALAEGSLVRANNGPIYVVRNGTREWIRSLDEFVAGGYRWESVVPVEDRVIRSIPLRIEDGLLLKGAGDRVYLVSDGRRRWITSAGAFTARGYTWAQVHFVSDATLQPLPEGAEIQ